VHNLIIREAITFTVVSRGVMQPSHVAHLALEAQMQSVVLGNIATLMFLAIPMKLCIYPYNRYHLYQSSAEQAHQMPQRIAGDHVEMIVIVASIRHAFRM